MDQAIALSLVNAWIQAESMRDPLSTTGALPAVVSIIPDGMAHSAAAVAALPSRIQVISVRRADLHKSVPAEPLDRKRDDRELRY